MSLSSYNRIYNLSLGVLVLYNIMFLADMFLVSVDLSGIIKYSAAIYLVFAFGMLIYKIQLTRKYFLGRDAIYNLIAHAVFTVSSIILILIALF